VDARYEEVRVDGRVVSEGVLIVTAVRDDGASQGGPGRRGSRHRKRRATYHELFERLKARGLAGVLLVVSDEHEGLKAAT
jgi:transposase-like protein